ncbi:MAG: hypothetical protein JWP66_1837 [Naasia sp.]|nr:hypothetical protein [Naasia sp.]
MVERRASAPLTSDPDDLGMSDDVSATVHESAMAISGLIRSVEKYRRRVAHRFGVSVTELRALAQLSEHDELTPRQLADRLDLTTGSVTALLDRLEEADLVRRTRHPSDRRSLQLQLTESGHRLMSASYRIYQQRLLFALRSLPEGSAQTVTAFMRMAAEGYDAEIDESFV